MKWILFAVVLNVLQPNEPAMFMHKEVASEMACAVEALSIEREGKTKAPDLKIMTFCVSEEDLLTTKK